MSEQGKPELHSQTRTTEVTVGSVSVTSATASPESPTGEPLLRAAALNLNIEVLVML
jgi:hypothetical protein